MKKMLVVILVFAFLTSAKAEVMKKADLAGSWYPSSKETLSSVLDSYIAAAEAEPIKGDIKAIIVPHAGLVYSGPVAAYAYKVIADKGYSTVLLLGFCHRTQFDGVSVYKEGYFETPLGPIEVDSQLASDIISRNEKIVFNPKAFENENSAELELPFIKKALPNSKIVPIAFGSSDYSYCKMMSDILAEVLAKRDDALLIASTDMSHFHSYDEAKRIDLESIELLKNFAAREIYEKSVVGEQIFCGYMPVATALLACEKIGADKIAVLHYANSGDVTGDRSGVVGYVSAAIYKNKSDEIAPTDEAGREKQQKGGGMLSGAQRKRLLEIARDTIKTYLKTGEVMQVSEKDPLLNKGMGAFVTLHKRGQLRGCIGNIVGSGPLYLTVRDMAIQSAASDPRFPKVTLSELDEIDIEISVLSELERISDVNKIEMGVHGVLIRKGFSSGVFLPQVATETGWTREEFLSNLCAHKAGLVPDAWKKGDVEIYIYTAEVFGEKDL